MAGINFSGCGPGQYVPRMMDAVESRIGSLDSMLLLWNNNLEQVFDALAATGCVSFPKGPTAPAPLTAPQIGPFNFTTNAPNIPSLSSFQNYTGKSVQDVMDNYDFCGVDYSPPQFDPIPFIAANIPTDVPTDTIQGTIGDAPAIPGILGTITPYVPSCGIATTIPKDAPSWTITTTIPTVSIGPFTPSVKLPPLSPAPQLNYGTTPAAPTVNPIDDEIAPDLSQYEPTYPALVDVANVPPPDTTLPPLAAVPPVFTAKPPILSPQYTPSPLESDTLDSLAKRFQDTIENGDDILDSGYLSNKRAVDFAEMDRLLADRREEAKRSFSLRILQPSGTYQRVLRTFDNEDSRARQIYTLAQWKEDIDHRTESVKIAVEAGLKIVDVERDLWKMTEDSLFEMEKFTADIAVRLYDLDIKAYGIQVQVFDTEVKAYLAKIDEIKARVEVMQAQVEVELAKSKINDSRVALYEASIKRLEAEASIYETKVRQVVSARDAETSKAQIYGSEISAFVAMVGAERAKVDVYSAEANALSSSAQALSAEASAYGSEVDAETAKVQAASVSVNAEAASLKAETDAYVARVSASEKMIAAEATQARMEADNYQAQVRGESASISAEATVSETMGRQYVQRVQAEGAKIAAEASIIQNKFSSFSARVNAAAEDIRAQTARIQGVTASNTSKAQMETENVRGQAAALTANSGAYEASVRAAGSAESSFYNSQGAYKNTERAHVQAAVSQREIDRIEGQFKLEEYRTNNTVTVSKFNADVQSQAQAFSSALSGWQSEMADIQRIASLAQQSADAAGRYAATAMNGAASAVNVGIQTSGRSSEALSSTCTQTASYNYDV